MNQKVNAIKLVYKDQIKRSNKDPESLDELLKVAVTLFGMAEFERMNYFLSYISSDSSINGTPVNSNEELFRLIAAHPASDGIIRFKLEENPSINDLIEGVEISESVIYQPESHFSKESQTDAVKKEDKSLATEQTEKKNQSSNAVQEVKENYCSAITDVVEDACQYDEKPDPERDDFKCQTSFKENECNFFNEDINEVIKEEKNKNLFAFQCSHCKDYPIKGTLHICLMCKETYLCPNCELPHNHPMIRIKVPEYSSLEDIARLLTDQMNTPSKSGIFKHLQVYNENPVSRIKGMFSGYSYKATLESLSDSYIAKPLDTINILINLTNDGSSSIPTRTMIIPKNTQELEIKPVILNSCIEPGKNRLIEVECKCPKVNKTFYVEFILFERNIKIVFETLKVGVIVDDGEDMLEEFNPSKEVKKLSRERKEVLRNIIVNEISKLDLQEIYEIMNACNWILEDALEKLTS